MEQLITDFNFKPFTKYILELEEFSITIKIYENDIYVGTSSQIDKFWLMYNSIK